MATTAKGNTEVSVMKLCLFLAIMSFAVYANTLSNGFALDDAAMITRNTIVARGFAGIPELLHTSRMAGIGHTLNDNYRPLSLVMFAIERQLFGDGAAAGHFFNVLFFAGCVVLLFLFLHALFDGRRTAVAFIAALLFLVHPIHTEVVANIKSRDEIMCFFFAFLSLVWFTTYMRQGRWLHLLLATLALFLAYLSKETVITFLLIIPLIFFGYLRSDMRRAAIIMASTVVATGAFLLIRSQVLGAQGAGTTLFMDNALVTADTTSRFATAIYVLGRYLLLLFVPYPLSCDYCFNSIPLTGFGNPMVLISLAVYLALAVVGIRLFLKDRQNLWALGILFFLITLSLFSNIPFLIGAEMGERFLFFPSVGFCLVAALAIDKWLLAPGTAFPASLKGGKAMAVLLPVFLLFAAHTIERNSDWKDNYTLYKTDAEKLPQNAKLHYFLGNELVEHIFPATQDKGAQQQNLIDALTALRQALNIYPAYADAHTETGSAFLAMGAYDSAAAHYSKALAIDPAQSTAANNLAVSYMRQGKFAAAVAAYRVSLALLPGNAQSWYDMGGCCIQLKEYDSAISALNRAIACDPSLTDAYMQLGLAYFSAKKYAEAEKVIGRALQIHPNDAKILGNLGAIYLNAGQPDKAAETFRQIITLQPGSAAGYSGLGHSYYRMNRFPEAIEALNKGISMKSRNEKDIACLALCYKAVGKTAEAQQLESIFRKVHPDFSLQGDNKDY